MELFLKPNSSETFLIELVVSYLKLAQKSKVTVVKLSHGALIAIAEGKLKLSAPSLVTSTGEIIQDTHRIIQRLVGETQWEQFFFGSNEHEREEISQVDKHNKQEKQILKHLQKYLESRTFFVSNHLTFADLYVFTKVYEILVEFTEEQKTGFNHLFRWYKNIQNLPDVKEFLVKSGRGLISDPTFKPSFLHVDKK